MKRRAARRWVVALGLALGVVLGASACTQYGTTGGEVTGLSYQRESGSIFGYTGECWRVEFEDAYGRTGSRCTSESRWSGLAVGDDYGTPQGAPTAEEAASERSAERLSGVVGDVAPMVLVLLGVPFLVVAAVTAFRSMRGAWSS